MTEGLQNEWIHVAQVVPATEAEGPGKRFALWFQGCPLRCPQCCNPEMLPFAGGQKVQLHILAEEVLRAQDRCRIEGITLLGGEPFAHAKGAAMFAAWAQQQGLSVMIFSGYLLDEIKKIPQQDAARLLAQTDILVDGPYRHDLPEQTRRWIGSSNQRVHFLSDKYNGNDPCWTKPNTLEMRLTDGELTVNGFPARSAVGLWKRPKRS